MRWGFCVFPSRLFVHTLSLGANPSGFRRLRTFWELWVLLPTGSSCARVAHWRVGVRTGARYSQAYFCLQLRNSRTNRNALVQTATLQPEWRHSLPNCGFIPELRRAFSGGEFFVRLRQFLANAGALAGLLRPRACLAHLTATSAAEAADGNSDCGWCAGQRLGNGGLDGKLTVGARRRRNSVDVWVANPAHDA